MRLTGLRHTFRTLHARTATVTDGRVLEVEPAPGGDGAPLLVSGLLSA